MPLSETSPSSSGAFSKGAWGAAGGLSSRQTRDDLRKSKEDHFHAGVEAPPPRRFSDSQRPSGRPGSPRLAPGAVQTG
jgi:hypothetical protein